MYHALEPVRRLEGLAFVKAADVQVDADENILGHILRGGFILQDQEDGRITTFYFL
jgi:hypothetical protein